MEILFQWLFSIIELFYFFKFVPPWAAGVRIRAGHFNKVVTGGTWFKLPIFDAFFVLNVQRQVLNFPNQVIRTADNHELAISAWCVYRIVHPEIPWLEVQDHDEAIAVKGMDLIAEYVNEMDEDAVDRQSLILHMTEPLQKFSLLWGCEVEECGITDLGRTKIYRLIQQDSIGA